MLSRKLIDRVVFVFAAAAIIGRLLISPRLDLPTAEGSYEAFAHLFVGALFGAGVARWDGFYLSVAIGLSLFELAMFVLQKCAAI